jgi:hypothetical protein
MTSYMINSKTIEQMGYEKEEKQLKKMERKTNEHYLKQKTFIWL